MTSIRPGGSWSSATVLAVSFMGILVWGSAGEAAERSSVAAGGTVEQRECARIPSKSSGAALPGRNWPSSRPAGYAERLPALAEELVRLKPNIILAAATGQAVAAKNATATITIVTPALADAVHLGLVASEARPKGNVTGITPYVAGLPAKQMELAREIVPRARKIGVLNDINDPKAAPQWLELEDAGRALGLNVVALGVRTPDDLASAFQALANQRPDVVIVLQTSMLLSERRKIADLGAAMRLPIIYGYREHIVDGGLISYGVDLRDCFRRSAVYVVRILNGTAPGDLPVEFPTKLELIINLKTAKALAIEIPPTLLARADEVIE